jgi:site-specific DNA recombinase
VFTGRVFCGQCGSAYAVSDGKFACTGRALMGVCDNRRRVPRQAVEETVLDHIKQHILSTDLLEPSLAAYREEADHALAEHALRTEGDAVRLKEIDQRIVNLSTQLGGTSEASFASQIVLQEIDRLGAEKTRLEHQARLAPGPLGPALEAGAVVERIRATLDDLQQALEGDDREAVRARELVRGLVERVTMRPTPGSIEDGRGAGDLTLTVEGPLAALIDLADLNINRVAKYEHRPTFVLDNATTAYRFSFVLAWRNPRLDAVFADLPLVSKLLDEADVPGPWRCSSKPSPPSASKAGSGWTFGSATPWPISRPKSSPAASTCARQTPAMSGTTGA